MGFVSGQKRGGVRIVDLKQLFDIRPVIGPFVAVSGENRWPLTAADPLNDAAVADSRWFDETKL